MDMEAADRKERHASRRRKCIRSIPVKTFEHCLAHSTRIFLHAVLPQRNTQVAQVCLCHNNATYTHARAQTNEEERPTDITAYCIALPCTAGSRYVHAGHSFAHNATTTYREGRSWQKRSWPVVSTSFASLSSAPLRLFIVE